MVKKSKSLQICEVKYELTNILKNKKLRYSKYENKRKEHKDPCRLVSYGEIQMIVFWTDICSISNILHPIIAKWEWPTIANFLNIALFQ